MAASRWQPYRADGIEALEAVCPDDNVPMTATGNVFLDPKFGDWYVEYYCPVEKEVRVMWSPDKQPAVEAATKTPVSDP
jgi:hypothetical protein